MKDFLLLQSASNAQIWVAHASRVLVSAARRNNLSTKRGSARTAQPYVPVRPKRRRCPIFLRRTSLFPKTVISCGLFV